MRALGSDVSSRQSPTGNWVLPINPEALKLALDRIAVRAGVEMAMHTSLIDAHVEGANVRGLRLFDHGGARVIEAAAFVDASGECNLAHLAGIAPSALYGSAHVRQPASMPVRISGVAPGVRLDRAVMIDAILNAPDRIGRALLRRQGSFTNYVPDSQDVWWLAIDLEADGLDGVDMGIAERDARELVWRIVQELRNAKGFERAAVAVTGPQLGIRETRHVAARHEMREAEATMGLRRPDGVARAAWPMEIHHGPGHAEYRNIGGDGWFDVRLDALRALGRDNLWLGGRTIGADPAAFASVRVMGTAFATGHAAGVAAAMQAQNGEPDIDAVRQALIAQRALL